MQYSTGRFARGRREKVVPPFSNLQKDRDKKDSKKGETEKIEKGHVSASTFELLVSVGLTMRLSKSYTYIWSIHNYA